MSLSFIIGKTQITEEKQAIVVRLACIYILYLVYLEIHMLLKLPCKSFKGSILFHIIKINKSLLQIHKNVILIIPEILLAIIALVHKSDEFFFVIISDL